jgi:hypothetical protein
VLQEFRLANFREKSLCHASLSSDCVSDLGNELRLPNATAQTRVVSVARIQQDSRKSVRPFKGIICDDISEFESYMASQAVRSEEVVFPLTKARLCRGRERSDRIPLGRKSNGSPTGASSRLGTPMKLPRRNFLHLAAGAAGKPVTK